MKYEIFKMKIKKLTSNNEKRRILSSIFLTWDQGHYSKHQFCFYLDLLLSIGWDCQLHTSMYDKRDYFNFHITNCPFLSSYIPSSPAYGVLSLSLYDTSGLAPRMDVLSWRSDDFPVSYWNRDTSWNAWNRHSGSIMVDMEILFNNMKSPSHEC